MCFFSTPKPPQAAADADRAVACSMEEVRAREQRERAQMALAGQGTAGTVKTDLVPAAVAGQQAPQRRVLLGSLAMAQF